MTEEEKFCFVVCPIGSPDSPTRKRSNGFFREVIEPVAKEFGYRVERADHDKAPGIVTEAIVTKIIESDLVIADLHEHNPNVMYEVAIRHATGEPIIQMIEEGEDLPFDIGGLNTIYYDPGIDALDSWRSKLRAAIEAVEAGNAGSNPVARAGLYRALEAKGEPTEEILARILRSVERLDSSVNTMTQRSMARFSLLHQLSPAEWESEFLAFLTPLVEGGIPKGWKMPSTGVDVRERVAYIRLQRKDEEKPRPELGYLITPESRPADEALRVARLVIGAIPSLESE